MAGPTLAACMVCLMGLDKSAWISSESVLLIGQDPLNWETVQGKAANSQVISVYHETKDNQQWHQEYTTKKVGLVRSAKRSTSILPKFVQICSTTERRRLSGSPSLNVSHCSAVAPYEGRKVVETEVNPLEIG